MPVTGTPTNIQEFIRLYDQSRSQDIRGLMGQDANQIPKDISILDIGCGIGNTLFALYANGLSNIYGLDVERRLLEYAKQIVPKAHLTLADAEHIPFGSETFDCVVCYDLLEHVLRPEKVLGEISTVLKEGGTLYISVANGYSINDIVFRWGGRILRGRSSHNQKFRKWHVQNLLKSNGFQISESCEIKLFYLIDQPVLDKIPFCRHLRRIAHKLDKPR